MSKPPRKRRTAEQARRVILDAAVVRLEQVGPAGIRLQQIAEDVGMSHPAILHHFGSREGLVNAVLAREVTRLRADLVPALGESVDTTRAAELLERVSETLGDRGHARLLAWLLLSGDRQEALDRVAGDRTLAQIGSAVHALRVRADETRDAAVEPAEEDTHFTVMLAALAMFGDAIAGDVIRASAGLEQSPGTDARFRAWLAKLLMRHLDDSERARSEPRPE